MRYTNFRLIGGNQRRITARLIDVFEQLDDIALKARYEPKLTQAEKTIIRQQLRVDLERSLELCLKEGNRFSIAPSTVSDTPA